MLNKSSPISLYNFLVFLHLSKDILLTTIAYLWFMFNISILVFSLVLHFPRYAGEDKNKAHEEEDEQGDETTFIGLIPLGSLALLPIVNLIRFAKRHGFFSSVN